MNIILMMKEIKDISASERRVLEYVLRNTSACTTMGIETLAKNADTSTTTVKRFCRKLGIDSYIDFRYELTMASSYQIQSENKMKIDIPIKRQDSIKNIIRKVAYSSMKSIMTSAKMNSEMTLETVAKMINNAEMVDFYGVGPSYLIAKDASLKCMRMGINSRVFGDSVEMSMNSQIATSNHLGIFVSYSGETKEVVESAKNLRKNDVPSISLTGLTENSLTFYSDVNLFVDGSEPLDRLGGMSSRIALMNTLDTIFTILFNLDYDGYKDTIVKSRAGK